MKLRLLLPLFSLSQAGAAEEAEAEEVEAEEAEGHLAAFGDDNQIVKKDVGLIVAVVEGHHVGADEGRLF